MWDDGNDEWKCCQPPTFNSIRKAAKQTLCRTKEQRNRWDFLFCSERRREASRGKIAEAKKVRGEERSEIKGHLGYVAKPKIKKWWRQENYYTWLACVFRRWVPALFKSTFFLCLPSGKIAEVWLFEIFSRVIVFASATLKNIWRVFNFVNSTKIRGNHRN